MGEVHWTHVFVVQEDDRKVGKHTAISKVMAC